MAGLAQTMMGGGFKPMGFLQMAHDKIRDKDKTAARLPMAVKPSLKSPVKPTVRSTVAGSELAGGGYR